MNNAQLEHLRLSYPPSTVVQLISMEGEARMPSGMTGVVALVDDAAQIHVDWQNGSSLALMSGLDDFKRMSVPAREKTPAKEHTAPQKTDRER